MIAMVRPQDAAIALCGMVLSGCGGGGGFIDNMDEAVAMEGFEGDRQVQSQSQPSVCANFKKMKEDCTGNKKLFTWKGGVQEAFVAPTYDPDTYDVSDDYWKTTLVSETDGWETLCVAYVRTRKHGPTCKHWCESQSNADQQFVCNKAMDDAHQQRGGLYEWLEKETTTTPTHCTVNPETRSLEWRISDGKPIDQSDNGCNAAWDTQICGCALVRWPVLPGFPGWPPVVPDSMCTWEKPWNEIVGDVDDEDCRLTDHHVWKGELREVGIAPSYAANTYGSDNHWLTKQAMASDTGPFPGACVAYIRTAGKTCKQWCADADMKCVGGMDDAHHQNLDLNAWQNDAGFPATKCTLFPGGHSRKKLDENGCKQNWKTQICACQKKDN